MSSYAANDRTARNGPPFALPSHAYPWSAACAGWVMQSFQEMLMPCASAAAGTSRRIRASRAAGRLMASPHVQAAPRCEERVSSYRYSALSRPQLEVLAAVGTVVPNAWIREFHASAT